MGPSGLLRWWRVGGLGSGFAQAEMLGHGCEIAVVVKQPHAVKDAPGADYEVDRLADADAAAARGAIMIRGLPGYLFAAEGSGLGQGVCLP